MEINLTQDKYCGKKQCEHIHPDKVSRCGQPVYTDGDYCYYHTKCRKGRFCPPEQTLWGKQYINFWSGIIMLMRGEEINE